MNVLIGKAFKVRGVQPPGRVVGGIFFRERKMDKEEICRIIDLLADAGYEVESIAVHDFPKPVKGTFYVRFNKKKYPSRKMDKEEIGKVIDIFTDAGYEVETITVDKFPKPPSGSFFVRILKKP